MQLIYLVCPTCQIKALMKLFIFTLWHHVINCNESFRICHGSMIECVPITISYHPHFLRLSNVWSMLHHGIVWWAQNKGCNFTFTCKFFCLFFVVFHDKICVFIIFVSFLDQVSKFWNKVLTNQKPELVMRNNSETVWVTFI